MFQLISFDVKLIFKQGGVITLMEATCLPTAINQMIYFVIFQ